jgi:3-oxoacyl-[acyl-carrier-protein] synthase-1
VAAVVSDMNGEAYRSGEWGMIQARYMNGVNGEKNLICPAKNIGDTGAASPGVGVCVAVRAMERGYLIEGSGNRVGQALILSSSDDGERGAMLVSGAPAYDIRY